MARTKKSTARNAKAKIPAVGAARIERAAALTRRDDELTMGDEGDLCPVLGVSMRAGPTVRSRGVLMSSRGAAAVRTVLTSGFDLEELDGAIEWLRARAG